MGFVEWGGRRRKEERGKRNEERRKKKEERRKKKEERRKTDEGRGVSGIPACQSTALIRVPIDPGKIRERAICASKHTKRGYWCVLRCVASVP